MLIKDTKSSSYFDAVDETVLAELLHPKNDGVKLDFSIAHAVLKPGKSSLPHILKESVEVYYILEGQGQMHIDREVETVESGQVVYIPPKNNQWIKNTGNEDLKFLCIVSPPWNESDEELNSH
jgi:mannose-6-phosphate isomerase-like protein (cupin superfamily)